MEDFKSGRGHPGIFPGETKAQIAERKGHPFFMRWQQAVRRPERVCEAWRKDFWRFVADVSPKPEGTKNLRRLRQGEPMGPGNFEWAKTPTKEEGLAYVRQWHKDNRIHVRDRRFREKYGITHADYEAMYAAQRGVCDICGQNESRFVRVKTKELRHLCVDHDHETGAVRGLLCGDCNGALGMFKDNPTTLLRAIGYLRHHARRRLKVVE